MANNPKSDALMKAAVAILSGAPRRMMKTTNLNKALFYLDLKALCLTGSTYTGNTYIALEQGPVVAHYGKRLVGELEKRGLAKQLTQGKALPVELVADAEKRIDADPRIAEIATWIASALGPAWASDVSRFSHENEGWKIAFESGLGVGERPKPIDMHIAMQQLFNLHEDPWMAEPVDDATAKRIRETTGKPDHFQEW